MGLIGGNRLPEWVRKLKPRKPFSNERKPTGNTLGRDSFTFNPHIADRKSKKRRDLLFRIMYLIVLAFVVTLIIVSLKKVVNNQPVKTTTPPNTTGYYMSLNYAQNYMYGKEWNAAIIEIEFALSIKPADRKANEMMSTCLFNSCYIDQLNCTKFNTHLDKMLHLFPNCIHFTQLDARRELMND